MGYDVEDDKKSARAFLTSFCEIDSSKGCKASPQTFLRRHQLGKRLKTTKTILLQVSIRHETYCPYQCAKFDFVANETISCLEVSVLLLTFSES